MFIRNYFIIPNTPKTLKRYPGRIRCNHFFQCIFFLCKNDEKKTVFKKRQRKFTMNRLVGTQVPF